MTSILNTCSPTQQMKRQITSRWNWIYEMV